MGVMQSIGEMGHEQVVFCQDKATGLKAIIAIHDTTLGPSLGGCRFWNYANEDEAIFDVLRLSRGMTYKAAIAGLSLGGGKAVIMGDPRHLKSRDFFRAFGAFVDSLSGYYITAEDVNISVEDMNQASLETNYVVGVTNKESGSGDPSPLTALGTYHGIRSAAKYLLGKSSVMGMKVAIQGCGSVGRNLCELLHKGGAQLIVSDINEAHVRDMVDRYQATPVSVDEIHAQDVDVLSPCALGGTINSQTIPDIKARVVAGAANNQLLDEKTHGRELKKRGILYAPDYVINAGGLINVTFELKGYDRKAVEKDVCSIYDTLLKVFSEAEKHNILTHEASNQIAEQIIDKARKSRPSGQQRNNYNNQDWIRRS